MNTVSLLQGIRFLDSLFPSGGYAFSSGLEAAVHSGGVTDGASLQRYVADLFEHGMGGREAVSAALAHDATIEADLKAILHVDYELDAMKLDRTTRVASHQMGRQVIRIAAQSPGTSILRDYWVAVESDGAPGHLAVALGATLAAAGWATSDAVGGFLYHCAAGMVSAGMKLLPLGQREAQTILDAWIPLIDRVSERAASERDLTSFSPIQDIYAMRHSRLSSRLFRS